MGKKRKNSKKIGNRNESAVANVLTSWWAARFQRMPASGALRWNGFLFTYGDLLPPLDFPGIIECKTRKELSLEDIWREKSEIRKWWYDQTMSDAGRCCKEMSKTMVPMMVWHQRCRPFRLCMPSSFMECHPESCLSKLTYFTIAVPNRESFVVTDLKEYIASVDKLLFLQTHNLYASIL